MIKPNIGDCLTMPNGTSGTVWGVMENANGLFVQFSQSDDWMLCQVDAAAPEVIPALVLSTPAPVLTLEQPQMK